jgi:hypothetical protein
MMRLETRLKMGAALVFALSTDALLASDVTVHGQVHEFTSPAPIAGANVSIQFMSFIGYVEIGSTITAADGTYAWAGNCPTSFTSLCRVRASAANHALAQQFFDAVSMPDADLEFALRQAAKISGVARTAGSQPLPHARIHVDCVPLDPACIYNMSAATADDGSYSVDGIPGGTYRVCFVPDYNDDDPLVGQCHDHIDWSAFAQDPLYSPLTLSDGEVRSGIDFDLHTGGTITGSVSDGYLHHSLANQFFSAQIIDAAGNPLFYKTVHSDADGHYEILGLPNGSYYLRLDPGQPFEGAIVYPDVHCATGCDPTTGQAITISNAATVPDIDFVFDPAAVVSGRITNAQNGNGLSGIPVRYSDCAQIGCSSSVPAITDAAGNFVLFVPAETPISIFTSNLRPWIDQAFPLLPCMGRGCEDAAPPLTFSVGEHRGNVDFALVLGATIAGRVVDAHPTEEYTVAFLLDSQMHGVFTAYPDETGNYETPAWFAGTYYMVGESDNACMLYDAVECDYGDYDPPAQPTPIVLQAGETRTGIDFLLDSADRIFRDGF